MHTHNVSDRIFKVCAEFWAEWNIILSVEREKQKTTGTDDPLRTKIKMGKETQMTQIYR